MTAKIRRLAYHAVATWPRQLSWLILAGQAFGWLLGDVLNGAGWAVFVSCVALGLALSFAVPPPAEIRSRLAALTPPPEGTTP